jgi:hypothetical protein
MIALLLAVLGIAAPPQTAVAWEEEYVNEGIAAAVEQAKAARDLTGFGLRSGGFCLLGGFIEEGKELTYTTKLQKDKAYFFIGAGDHDVKDLDLVVGAKDGSDHQVDVDDDATPFVFVAPSASAEYSVTMRVASGSGSGSVDFCLVIVLETGGLEGSLDTLAESAHQLNSVVAIVAEATDVELDTAEGSFCLLGALLKDGADQKLTRSFEANRTYQVIGWADENAKDFDVDIRRDKEVITQDIDEDSTPVVTFESHKKERLGVNLSMFSSNHPAFAIVAIVTPAGDDD